MEFDPNRFATLRASLPEKPSATQAGENRLCARQQQSSRNAVPITAEMQAQANKCLQTMDAAKARKKPERVLVVNSEALIDQPKAEPKVDAPATVVVTPPPSPTLEELRDKEEGKNVDVMTSDYAALMPPENGNSPTKFPESGAPLLKRPSILKQLIKRNRHENS